MSDEVVGQLTEMREEQRAHLRLLVQWKASGGKAEGLPGGLSINDLIHREEVTIERLTIAINYLKAGL